MKKIALFISAVILLASCKSKVDFNEELKQTGELRNNMKLSAAEFFKIDSAEIEHAGNTIDSYLNFVNEVLRDTISPEEATMLSNFKSIKKSFGKYGKAKKQVDRYFKYNLKQLDNLEHDLKEGIVEVKDSAIRYVNLEATASNNLSDIMKLNTSLIPMELRRYDSLKPLVEGFIKKINKGTIPPDLLKESDKKKKGEEEDDD